MGGEPGGSRRDEEADAFDFVSTFRRLQSAQCRVHEIIIKGNDRTKESVIFRELKPVLQATTLEELKDGLLASYAQMEDLGIFDRVDILADAGPEHVPNSANVHITLEEKPIYSLHTGTFMQGGEGSLEATLRAQNALGYAETIEANAAYGLASSSTFAATVVQPHWRGGESQLEVRTCKTHKSMQQHSSYNEELRGASVTLLNGRHQLEYELAWRKVAHAAEAAGVRASRAVMQQAGDSLKSAVKYAFAVDTREDGDGGFPVSGWALRWRSELSGLPDPSMLRFARQEVEAAAALPLARGVALALSLHLGGMVPLGADWERRTTHISDRFFLGGPGSLRGFRTKGVGPSDERRLTASAREEEETDDARHRDALGGDLMLSGLAALTFELPVSQLRTLGIHGHLFANAGTLLPITGAGAPRRWEDVRDSMRASVGAGLVFPTRIGRLELNYCAVLRALQHDRPKHGFQVGLAASGAL